MSVRKMECYRNFDVHHVKYKTCFSKQTMKCEADSGHLLVSS